MSAPKMPTIFVYCKHVSSCFCCKIQTGTEENEWKWNKDFNPKIKSLFENYDIAVVEWTYLLLNSILGVFP